ncbi:PA14 domain protein [Roseimaritima multifibrata]|uniref:PA14 domain protein n=2 Tax=Roseimaritima multifibrata TaxID=1930274 RepID=A0A517MM50_9BACT|nr:PA14 domain protein [Roseimaritima multifibrata]
MSFFRFVRDLLLQSACLTVLIGLFAADYTRVMAAEPTLGERIYLERCADCHGVHGEGVEGAYDEPLLDERSHIELTDVIVQTMPEGAPDECTGEDAEAVAKYLRDVLYPRQAAAVRMRTRVELSRLTVRQHQNTLADLIGSFRNRKDADKIWQQQLNAWRAPASADESAATEDAVKDDKEPTNGLRGTYFKSRVVGFRDRVFDRIDDKIDFDFGEGSPDPKLSAEEFAMAWDGSVLASESGEYEFVVDSMNGVRLFVNDLQNPIVDAVVQSGDQTEHRGTVHLLAGRSYSVRLEYYRSKRDKLARVALRWTPPNHVSEVIPHRALVPWKSPETFVVTTSFPPDDRSTGYERGNAISREWDDATTDAALETAAYVVDHLDELSGSKQADENREEKLKAFCEQFAERAFRRPLAKDVHQFYIENTFAKSEDAGQAVKLVVLMTLKSPRFLYHLPGSENGDDYDRAARLSYAIWDSLPDKELLKQAKEGRLGNPTQLHRQAIRMVEDPRAQVKLRGFLHAWLGLDTMHGLSKDRERYADFGPPLVSDLRTSLNLFLDQIVWEKDSDYRRLLLNNQQFFNRRMAEYYGVPEVKQDEFQRILFQPDYRAGALTHPYVMAGFAYSDSSSPIHRGVLVARSVLGRTLRAPPQAELPLPPDSKPDLTTRQRVALQTSSDDCMVCHRIINPLGFSFEHFDAVGQFRPVELERPIDASGIYLTSSGEKVTLETAVDLAEFLAESPSAHGAFTDQLFRYLAKQPIQAFPLEVREQLVSGFQKSSYHIRDLVADSAVAIAAAAPKTSPSDPSPSSEVSKP